MNNKVINIKNIVVANKYLKIAYFLLSYISSTLLNKYPTIKAKFTTEQEGNSINFTIYTEEPYVNLIDNFLKGYSQILLSKAPMNIICETEEARMELSQALDLSALAVKVQLDLENPEEKMTSITKLNQEVRIIHDSIGSSILNNINIK
jgi:hypothetical protein